MSFRGIHTTAVIGLATALAVVLGATPEQEPTRRVAGASFSVPLPDGFSPLSSGAAAAEIWDAGGMVAVQATSHDGFRGNIVVNNYQVLAPGLEDLGDLTYCSQIAQMSADSRGATLEDARIVDVHHGRTCQLTTRKTGASGEFIQIITVMARSAERWALACSFAATDTAGPVWCREVVDGWRFSPEK